MAADPLVPAEVPTARAEVSTQLEALAAWRRTLWLRMRPTFKTAERLLLLSFLAGRFSLLKQWWGIAYGHDAGFQMEVSRKVTLFGPRLGLHECFNCYQPPLGFLFPKWLMELTGVTETSAAQLVGFLFSLWAFGAFRGVLKHLGLLHRPMGMALLYLSMTMPVMQYLAYGITLDSQMLFYASAVLWLSTKAFWPRNPAVPASPRVKWAAMVALVITLAASTMVKYSGFLLFALPGMVAFIQGWRHQGVRPWVRNMGLAAATGAVALLSVLPYYYSRYYTELGKFTPIAIDWMAHDEVEKNRKEIHANPGKFLVDIFSPTPTVKEHPDWNDPKTARLHDTWRFFFIRSHVLGWRARDWGLSLFYLDVMPWLMLLGGLMLWRTFRRQTAWSRLGFVVAAQSFIYWASMIWYNYSNPFPLYVPIKAIYIAPAAWGIAFVLAHVLQARWMYPWLLARRWRLTQWLMLACVGVYTFLNSHLACY